VVVSALLLTVGVFVSVNLGSWQTRALASASEARPSAIPHEPMEQEEPGRSGDRVVVLARSDAAAPAGAREDGAAAVALAVNGAWGWPSDAQSVRRLAGALESVGSGVTPSVDGVDLPSMRDMLVRRDPDGLLVVAAGTQRRYRSVVGALATIDPEAAAEWCRRSGAELDRVPGVGSMGEECAFELLLRQAVEHVLAVDIPEEPVVLVSRGARWGFVDADLEALSRCRSTCC